MKKLLVLVAASVLISGCATIFTGTEANVKVNATPAAATIVIKAQTGQVFYQGEVPAEVKLPKKNTYSVEVSLTGYKTQSILIGQNVEGWFWGNLCLGGVVGMVIDWATGGMWDLNPKQIDAKLVVAMTNGASGPAVVFYARDDQGQLRYIVVPLVRA